MLNGFLLALDLDNPLVGVCFQISPRVKHAILYEPHETSGWLQSGELVDEQLFEFRLADVHRAAARAAVVVRVVVAPSLRPARRQRLAARLAAHVTPERKIEIVSLTWRRDFEPAVQDCLDAVEDLLADERLEVATRRDAVVRHIDLPDVDAIAQHAVKRLRGHGLTTPRFQTECDDGLSDFMLRESPGREVLKRPPNERRALRVRDQTLAHRARCVHVAKWCEKRPSPEFECRSHTGARSIRAHVVVELRECGEDAFHQFAGGRVVDRLRRRPQRDPQRFQVRAKREVVVLLAREARQVKDNNKLHPAFVKAAVLQKLLELSPIGCLGALAFLTESCEDFEALTLAVLLAGFELRREAQVLGLLLRADADVRDCADHWPQLRSVRRRRQGDRRIHRLVRLPVSEKQVNHDASDNLRVLTHAIDFLVCQIDAVVPQQLATALDRGLVNVGRSDLVHRFPHRIRRAIT